MYPQFEEELQIEHIQGYLYVQQLIINSINWSQGCMNEYSIIEIEDTKKDLKSIVVDLVLNRLKGNTKLEQRHFDFLNKEANFFKLENWKLELEEKLEIWFVDRVINLIEEKSEVEKLMPNSLSNEQKEKRLREREKKIKAINNRFTNEKPCIKSFIKLVRQNLKTQNIEVYEFSIEGKKKENENYLWYMNLYWGMSFNIFLLKNKEKLVLLHLGTVIT